MLCITMMIIMIMTKCRGSIGFTVVGIGIGALPNIHYCCSLPSLERFYNHEPHKG